MPVRCGRAGGAIKYSVMGAPTPEPIGQGTNEYFQEYKFLSGQTLEVLVLSSMGRNIPAESLPLLWRERDLLETLSVALRASRLTAPGQDRDQHCLMWE